MGAHAMPSADVVRLPVRLCVVPAPSALDRLRADGTLDDRQHAAGLAYWRVCVAFGRAARSARRGGAGLSLPEAAWFALKREHAALLRAAGAERFILDRLCLDDDPPLRCEVERVGAALGRVAGLLLIPSVGSDLDSA